MASRKVKIEELKVAIGTAAEEAIMFFRACQGAGATLDECKVLTEAFLGALIHGPSKKEDDAGDGQ